jgi:hypothetical protein
MSRRSLRHPPPGWGVPRAEHVESLVKQARVLIQSVPVAADVPKIRDRMIEILDEALSEANKLAEQASPKPEKGQGGVPSKIHWLRVIGYLSQVLDGVCENVELSELNERLLRVEKELDVDTKPAQTH